MTIHCECGHSFEPIVEYRHRLLCGDATNKADVGRLCANERPSLIVTDPPYGISYNRHIPNPTHPNMINDETPEPKRLLSAIPTVSAIYLWSRWDVMHLWVEAIPLKTRNIIVWDKGTNGMGDLSTTYAPSWEACIFATSGGHKLRGGRDRDVWESPRAESDEHLTPKPLTLIEKCVFKSSDEGDCVLDPFVGSGTTLVAAENLNRKCYAIEISPAYVAVCLERMTTAFPSVKIEKVESARAA